MTAKDMVSRLATSWPGRTGIKFSFFGGGGGGGEDLMEGRSILWSAGREIDETLTLVDSSSAVREGRDEQDASFSVKDLYIVGERREEEIREIQNASSHRDNISRARKMQEKKRGVFG